MKVRAVWYDADGSTSGKLYLAREKGDVCIYDSLTSALPAPLAPPNERAGGGVSAYVSATDRMRMAARR
ncbi:hypothetical protein BOSE62_130820 [Bosea sp. 62]|nr:hypothetical protein BOSE7B_120850 [Bosea sp. 7B]CAD5273490.1 hypothetical protein BOSE21B_30063 [Bosea sp. 21B]CAD5284610.1 hypothetical protein BOSE46_50185 [Bosea sp. 46]VVT60199.1 hypothetical protein BOS5A_210990 [Bosea sp. EC-HK365B]VXB58879.1 hypothetical protein BOSE62_130820 [Bosea sp. 62]VXC11506.1 hypothetical protein BOSE29B_30061 [Bosea sp. 29B]VXC21167.1 hypothetical protein BOSE127_170488 [Bosea sp. 127]VXC63997.1 hypothetical protein BOSE125_30442 [Bosea sp. 125]